MSNSFVLDPAGGYVLPSRAFVEDVYRECAFETNLGYLEEFDVEDPESEISLGGGQYIDFESLDESLRPLAGLGRKTILEKIQSLDGDESARVRDAIISLAELEEPSCSTELASQRILDWLRSIGAKTVASGTVLGSQTGPEGGELWRRESIYFIVFLTGNGHEPDFLNVVACHNPLSGTADYDAIGKDLAVSLETGRAEEIFAQETGLIGLPNSEEPFRFVET